MKFIDMEMTRTETKPVTLEVLDLQESETVESVAITHTPPSGSPITIEETIKNDTFINMLFGPFEVPGYHFVVVQAVGSNGSEPETVYFIKVR